MSAALVQAHAQRLDALTVIGDLRYTVGSGGAPVARHLLAVLQAANDPQSLLKCACEELMRDPDGGHRSALPRDPGPHPWPLPDVVLWSRLLTLIGELLKRDPSQACGWACFRATQHGAGWLLDAERLAVRDGHLMRQRGGLQLPSAVFDGAQLRAEILPADSGAESRGDVLRLTWEDTGRLAAQSLPGRFGDADPSAWPE